MLEDQLYRQELLETIRNPLNRGKIDKPDLGARLDNPLCGDEVEIQIELDSSEQPIENRRIKIAKHSGVGCAISLASADLLTQSIEGKTLAEVKNLKSDDILNLLEINPTPTRMKCALLSLDTLKKAILENK